MRPHPSARVSAYLIRSLEVIFMKVFTYEVGGKILKRLKFLKISNLQNGLNFQKGLDVQQYEYVRRMFSGPSVPVCVFFFLGVCQLLKYRTASVTDQRFLWNVGGIVLEGKPFQVPLFYWSKTAHSLVFYLIQASAFRGRGLSHGIAQVPCLEIREQIYSVSDKRITHSKGNKNLVDKT